MVPPALSSKPPSVSTGPHRGIKLGSGPDLRLKVYFSAAAVVEDHEAQANKALAGSHWQLVELG
jgi:hypothetical protein